MANQNFASLNQQVEGLWKPNSGDVLDEAARYQIVGLHHTSENTPTLRGQSVYIAKDTKMSKFVTVVVLSEPASRTSKGQREAQVEESLLNTSGASDYLLLAVDKVMVQRGGEHLCYVYELIGPELNHFITCGNDTGLPGNWIQKVFKDVLIALKFLHSHEIVHGAIELMSLVMTYPKLDAGNESAVREHYGFGEGGSSAGFAFNNLGNGCDDVKPNLDFQVKLQHFHRAFKTSDKVGAPNKHKGPGIPPPELAGKKQLGPGTDIWYLAGLIINFVTGTPAEYNFLEDKPKVVADSVSATADAICAAILESRGTTRDEADIIQETGSGDFSEAEDRLIADLLAHMLDANPEERWSAEKALEHEFFAVARPAT